MALHVLTFSRSIKPKHLVRVEPALVEHHPRPGCHGSTQWGVNSCNVEHRCHVISAVGWDFHRSEAGPPLRGLAASIPCSTNAHDLRDGSAVCGDAALRPARGSRGVEDDEGVVFVDFLREMVQLLVGLDQVASGGWCPPAPRIPAEEEPFSRPSISPSQLPDPPDTVDRRPSGSGCRNRRRAWSSSASTHQPLRGTADAPQRRCGEDADHVVEAVVRENRQAVALLESRPAPGNAVPCPSTSFANSA